MFKLVAFALVALAALLTVNGAPILRRNNQKHDAYHARYAALGCENKQNTQFFDDCCHPLKQGETLENRPAYCTPGANPSSSLSDIPSNTLLAEPSSSPAPGSGDDDCEDDDDNDSYDDGDDDCGDEPSSSPAYEPSPTPTPSTPAPDNTTPTPTPTPEPSPSSSTDNASPSPAPDSSSGSETHTGGDLTWFTQNGVAGACGTVHSDSDFIAALDSATYGDTGSQSSYCGKTIRITWQGNSVDVVVADACPTCSGPSSVDLSEAAFQALAPLSVGLLSDATWELL